MRCTRAAAIGLLLCGLAAAQSPHDLNGNLYDNVAVESGSQAAAADAPYWWMNKGSPFKRSYDSQQSSSNNYNSNPFLNGASNFVADSLQAAASPVAAYAAPGYLPPTENVVTISCAERGQVCVTKYLCRNGFVDREVTDGSKQTCNTDNEVCCTIREAATPAPPPPKPQGIPCADKNYGCVPADQCYNGVVSSLNGFSSTPAGQNCFAPDVCCRFSDLNSSQNQVSEHHLPIAKPTPQPTPTTPSEVLTSEGYVITVPESKLPAQQPKPQPQPQPQPQPTQRPYQPQPQPPTQRPYQPPQQPQHHTQAPAATPAPQTPRAPYQGNEYVPPQVGDSSQNQPQYVYKPTLPPAPPARDVVHRGEEEKSQPIGNPSNNNPSIVRPHKDAPPPLPPTQCPAATNCTEIEFCTANGFISKTAVRLSPDQETYRVPLSECRSVERGFVGKCCRDPDYTDPWPVGILGQYNATILGFDDGSYKPAPAGGAGPGRPAASGPNGRNVNGISGNGGNGFNQGNGFNNPGNQGFNQGNPGFNGNQGNPGFNGNQGNQGFNGNQGNPGFNGNQGNPGFNGNNGAPQQVGGVFNNPAPGAIGFGGETQASNTVAIRGQSQLSQPIASQTGNNQFGRQPFPQGHPNQIPQQHQPQQPQRDNNPFQIRPIASGQGQCAVRDANAFPKGAGPYDAAFGEFPWQAMILKESTKSLLCGGAIIQANAVLTAANCVNGQKPFDILVKGGEWRLGSDEEPKPFQTVRVKSISFHPEYQSFGRDVALLHLEIDLKFDQHIAPICIDDKDATPVSGGNDQCVCTGWGKEALKYHAPQAVMHQIPIAPLDQNDCAAALGGNFNGQTAVCGRPQVDACQIDSGSALACTHGDGQYRLKGLYSTENQCNSPQQIVTFAKMDVQWIRDTVAAPSNTVQRQVPQPSGFNNFAQPQRARADQQYNSIPAAQQSKAAPSYLPPRN